MSSPGLGFDLSGGSHAEPWRPCHRQINTGGARKLPHRALGSVLRCPLFPDMPDFAALRPGTALAYSGPDLETLSLRRTVGKDRNVAAYVSGGGR